MHERCYGDDDGYDMVVNKTMQLWMKTLRACFKLVTSRCELANDPSE